LTYQREILRQLGKKLFPIEKLHWPSNEFNDFLSESSTCNNPFLKTLFSFHSISIEENSERFIPSITQNLPPNWRVISATLNQQKTGIFFAVFLRDRQPFFVFRQLTGNFNDFHSQLTDILNKNDQISREGVFCRQKADKKRWWESRKRLDNELKDLVENIQITFVGALDV
jgi:hypothetical protein